MPEKNHWHYGRTQVLSKDFQQVQPSELAGDAPKRCHCEFISRITDSLPRLPLEDQDSARALPSNTVLGKTQK